MKLKKDKKETRKKVNPNNGGRCRCLHRENHERRRDWLVMFQKGATWDSVIGGRRVVDELPVAFESRSRYDDRLACDILGDRSEPDKIAILMACGHPIPTSVSRTNTSNIRSPN